jgi:hypothetical protein
VDVAPPHSRNSRRVTRALALAALLAVSTSTFLVPGGSAAGPDLRLDPLPRMTPGRTPLPPRDAAMEQFVRFVARDVQDAWERVFAGAGLQYERTALVLFNRSVQTGCGRASAQMGPFYCPADRRVYFNREFFLELERLGAPGDFAQAYVIAHEFGHHVQSITGIAAAVATEQQRLPARANALSVRLELQADCLAGVWGSTARDRGLLEPGDVEEGLAAAAAVGDDRLLMLAGLDVTPEAFTHGSSKQRTRWFRRGLERGDPNACETFDLP